MNNLKLLQTETDIANLKLTQIQIDNYAKNILNPLKDTLSGEIRRYITIHRKLEVAIKEAEIVSKSISSFLGGQNDTGRTY